MVTIKHIFYIRARQAMRKDFMASVIKPLQAQLHCANIATSLYEGQEKGEIFRSIFNALSDTKALIVFDRIEVLEGSDESQEFPLFLRSLFRETQKTRVLITARKPLGLSSLGGVGERVYNLVPLTFKNTVSLFAILCPHAHTSERRRRLIEHLVSDHTQADLRLSDEGLKETSRDILKRLGEGIPSKTFEVVRE